MPRRKPIDQDRVRALALALPETKEGLQLGRPDFRVKGKSFLALPEDGTAVHLKLAPARVKELAAADAATFSDVWDGNWVGINLAKIKPNQLLDLVIEGWRQSAPKRIASKPLAKKL